jgi:hypothetical protein
MILLDSDVLLIDLRYPNDAKFAVNRQTLDRIRDRQLACGITIQTLLETVGILSFNLSSARLPRLPNLLRVQYRLSVVPDPQQHPGYAGCTIDELVQQMSQRMALGDAVQAVQVRRHAPTADCLLSWNSKHFVGKLPIPTYTPEEWLQRQAP